MSAKSRAWHIADMKAKREAHIEAEIARIEAAPPAFPEEAPWIVLEAANPHVEWKPFDPALAAQFAHLRTETFRRPEGYVAWGDEVPPGGDAA